MKKIISSILIIVCLLATSTININAFGAEEPGTTTIVKPMVSSQESFDGYILYTEMWGFTTYLMDDEKNIVNTWIDNHPGMDVHLLENGNIIRNSYLHNIFFVHLIDLLFNPGKFFIGGTGCVEMRDWNNALLWEFEYSNSQHYLHHDIEPLPNGNILMIAYEKKTSTQAINAGRNPNLINYPLQGIWPDHIIEVQPNLNDGSASIVWEWHAWDHLIQDYNPSKANYGVVADHPELIDINRGSYDLDWLHTNSVNYNEELDQILLSVPHMNEIWIIDHSTTTQEAAGHTGGNSGKGGDLLYRWGNPQIYGAGDTNDQQLFHQHDARWIEPGCPGAGDITIYNSHNEPTSVDEIVLPAIDSDGNYHLVPGQDYVPEEPTWSISSEYPYNFQSKAYSGVQRLPDGNTLISSADNHSFFVVTPDKNLVWKYDYAPLSFQEVFKMEYYPPEYSGIKSISLNIQHQQSSTQSTPQSTPSSQPSQPSSQPSTQTISTTTKYTTISTTTKQTITAD